MKNLRFLIYFLGLIAVGVLVAQPSTTRSQELPPGKPAILEFSRKLCPVCAEMEVILKNIKVKYGSQVEVRIFQVDTDEPLFKKYRITFVPTQVFLDSQGREVFRNEGLFTEKEIVAKLKELGYIGE
jgi:thioredoxin 1